MYSGNRNEIRRFFLDAWRKHRAGESLSTLERMIADTVARHPEYHALFDNEEKALTEDFTETDGGSNPFLHLGMHLSLQEQLGADRPAGIRTLYQQTVAAKGDLHAAEHLMMECLARSLWEAQSTGTAPDETRYLDCLSKLVTR